VCCSGLCGGGELRQCLASSCRSCAPPPP
jgi:hypothetical protein